MINLLAVSNIEEELTKVAGKDGWIKLQEFMRFAYGTELCKVVTNKLQGDPSGWLKPPVYLHLGCSVTLPGQ